MLVLACDPKAGSELLIVGLEKPKTQNITINVRRIKSSICRVFNLRMLVFCNSLMNRKVLKSMVLSFRRFSKWRITGIAAAIRPSNTSGLRKVMVIACESELPLGLSRLFLKIHRAMSATDCLHWNFHIAERTLFFFAFLRLLKFHERSRHCKNRHGNDNEIQNRIEK